MENMEFTIDEIFEEISKLNTEEKVALSKNLSIISVIAPKNCHNQYRKMLEAIDDQVDTLKSTKIALKKLKSNLDIKYCQQLKERAEAFVPPEDAFILPDVKASEFARMTNIVAGITMRPIEDCSRIVYDILTRLSLLRNQQINKDSTDEDIIDSAKILKLHDIDATKPPCNLFAELYNKRETFSLLNRNAIAMSIAGVRNSEYSKVLINNWDRVSKPISLGKVVESVYSLKETTEAMNQYFAGLKESL